ncbi:MAG: hypothetical protein AAFP97_08495 [Pseudomonadota bacterium]
MNRPNINMLIKVAGAAALLGVLGGCATAEQKAAMVEQRAAIQENLSKVRFISEEQTKECEYVDQVTITQAMEFISGTAGLEPRAKEKIRFQAAARNADGVRIVDRVLSKGQGGYDKTRLSMTADVYNCNK